ncbi:hypothetical protein D8B26_000109 [Coccidioides posadasii str. Silveira]|uniref:Uncharacterized protein n=1 Tax=Coccidioides posadasii (strain RMSCC 757 / Silveira) TaxID=443226 RepID=E9D7M0_COCPS|nr:conserved hypothetical protein [Coccidioides posadasii str. Silveira]QVM05398.1 hypothetical protein D8B26_000109 [Coccidioides posadasii str. Silveira]
MICLHAGPPKRPLVATLAVFTFFALLYLSHLTWRSTGRSRIKYSAPKHSSSIPPAANTPLRPPELVKPENLTISGMVFFGRRSRVRSLHCYLERNLVDNGGWLDEVRFFANTKNKDDLAFLDQILKRSPRYKKIFIEKPVWWPDHTKLWRQVERGTMYIKLDDDIMWLADDAIPNMVTTKLQNPDFLAVSANVINGPPLSFLHYHHDALHPYFPELLPSNKKDDQPDPRQTPKNDTEKRSLPGWRPSEHPFWEGPNDFEWPLENEPPSDGHRWLRVQDDKALNRTPVAKLTYDFWGPTYESWAIAAQQHYSLLENIEKNTLDRYKFSPAWNMRGERIRINALAILGDDVLDTDVYHWPDNRGDEDMIALDLPKQLNRHILIEGKALAAHFNFMHQGALTKTDLLDRYYSYALDKVCKRPFIPSP